MSGTFTFMFKDLASYDKYKKEVCDNGGRIKHDLGTTLLGFTADMPPALVQTIQKIQSDNFTSDSGILVFEPDKVVTIQ